MTESLANRERNYMRFVSWNVNGLRAVLKKGFEDIVCELDAGIVALQETKLQFPASFPFDVPCTCLWQP